jgi:cytochrome c oxidase subunit 2
MKRTRLVHLGVLGLAAVVFAVQPVAAQTSSTAGLINELNTKLLYIAIPVTLIVEAVLIYAVIRFRNNDDPKPTRENRRLEITWTIATALVLLFVGVASYGVLANENVTAGVDGDTGPDEDDVVVRAEAYQWNWQMSYPQHDNFTTGTEMVIPANTDVYIRVTSRDVIHSYHVPQLGLKQDAMPGTVHTIKTVAYEEGTYQGYCAEYCGVAHSQMYFTVKVVSQEEYEQFVAENTASETTATPTTNATATPTGNATVTPDTNTTATPTDSATATPTATPAAAVSPFRV